MLVRAMTKCTASRTTTGNKIAGYALKSHYVYKGVHTVFIYLHTVQCCTYMYMYEHKQLIIVQ